jgi:hypothetical protein
MEFLQIYEKQLAASMSVRSLSQLEIERFISNAKGSMVSIQDFAQLLIEQYP